jgi:hypothetical protein
MRLLYDEISPITGNKSVLVEHDQFSGDDVKLCMESGYQTYFTSWKITNEELIADLENQFPYDVVKSKFIDSGGNVWFKSFLISPNVLLYPDDNSWCVANLIDLDPGSGIAIPIPISPDTIINRYLDESNTSIFGQFNFEDALFEFQRRIAISRLENEN